MDRGSPDGGAPDRGSPGKHRVLKFGQLTMILLKEATSKS